MCSVCHRLSQRKAELETFEYRERVCHQHISNYVYHLPFFVDTHHSMITSIDISLFLVLFWSSYLYYNQITLISNQKIILQCMSIYCFGEE